MTREKDKLMEYGQIPGVKKPVARLIQGVVMISSERQTESFALLDEIYALGGNTFDTAHVYGRGDVDRTLGRWVNERGVREDAVIVGKCAHHNEDRARVTPFDISADLHDSLARMNTGYIDLLLLHRDDPRVPVGPVIETLNEHLAAGRIHAYGMSNWTHERIQAANEYAEAHNLVPIAASSPNFSLAEQHKEPWTGCVSIGGERGRAAREWYGQQGMPLLTWSSLAGGFFSGRFRRDNLGDFQEYLDRLCVDSYCYEDNFLRLERAEALAAQKGLSLPQIALAYVLSQPLNIFALVGCNHSEEFRANLKAMAIELTPDELEWLETNDEITAQP
jgi:aryl-alcohol dehydrogenase-like predicted oxidoreductase